MVRVEKSAWEIIKVALDVQMICFLNEHWEHKFPHNCPKQYKDISDIIRGMNILGLVELIMERFQLLNCHDKRKTYEVERVEFKNSSSFNTLCLRLLRLFCTDASCSRVLVLGEEERV
ncbi:CLUMA_CG005591, isoform A [Clunio marinus]|uniref:CLUMA_CG005591, isoform A n=1 Tax=Clunio marinus TaxID=568069 RepID=A0A1J1HVJ0_9DIPT|nr:CLUMA_CG005591, isoform A [Clunio marinus]